MYKPQMTVHAGSQISLVGYAGNDGRQLDLLTTCQQLYPGKKAQSIAKLSKRARNCRCYAAARIWPGSITPDMCKQLLALLIQVIQPSAYALC